MSRHMIVLEVSNATDEMIQTDLGEAINDFCYKNKGTGITASVVTDDACMEIKDLLGGNDE